MVLFFCARSVSRSALFTAVLFSGLMRVACYLFCAGLLLSFFSLRLARLSTCAFLLLSPFFVFCALVDLLFSTLPILFFCVCVWHVSRFAPSLYCHLVFVVCLWRVNRLAYCYYCPYSLLFLGGASVYLGLFSSLLIRGALRAACRSVAISPCPYWR